MWICPVCGEQNNEHEICGCGWPETENYLAYPTCCQISEQVIVQKMLPLSEQFLKKGKELQKSACWEEAVVYLEKAAECGSTEAMKALAECFRNGNGVAYNPYQALVWYCKIMIAGTEDVSLELDSMYEEIRKGRVRKTEEISHVSENRTSQITVRNILSRNFYLKIESKLSKDWVRNIIFEDTLPEADSVMSYDVSDSGTVRLWLVQHSWDAYDVHIGARGGVEAPEDCSDLFYRYINVEHIFFRNNFRTDKVINMSRMFYDCWNLQKLDISSFDVKNVTDMSRMFASCRNLQELKFGSFDTSKVKDMSWLFSGCEQLEQLDVSSFRTENVKNMAWTFWRCAKLKELDLNSFHTENVTDMSCMFYGCESLETLNLNSFDTKNVKNMDQMFVGCTKLREVSSNPFNMKNVEHRYQMFGGYRKNFEKKLLG